MISDYEFLTPQECAATRDVIHGLKDYWENRAKGLVPFYSLGTASYMDASKSDYYYKKARRLNPILKSHFSRLYTGLSAKLSEICNMPVVYEEELALPGFHIFLADEAFTIPLASEHFDLQFKPFNWNYTKVDYDNPISFTCSVALPKEGAGLNYWDIKWEDIKDLPKSEFEKLKGSKQALFFPYELGKLIVHKGLILHQIAPCENIIPEDERITLQGHGLVCDGKLRLYW